MQSDTENDGIIGDDDDQPDDRSLAGSYSCEFSVDFSAMRQMSDLKPLREDPTEVAVLEKIIFFG